MCRQPRLLEHIFGQLALCTVSDRSLGKGWHEALGQVQVQALVQVVGLVWLGEFRARCGLLGDSLLSGDATWASSVCAASSGLGAG